MKKISTLTKTVIALALAASAASASATQIVGKAGFSFGLVTVTATAIDWNTQGLTVTDVNPGFHAAPTFGGFATSIGSNSGVFKTAAFTSPMLPAFMQQTTFGKVHDLSSIPGDANFLPVGVPYSLANFVSFDAQPNWLFTATFLSPGDQGPFSLTQVGPNVSATISVNGKACDAGADGICNAGDDVTDFTSIFSAQYTNETIPHLIATLLGGGTLPTNDWSGTLEARASAIPEPGSLALLGLALAGLGLARRRKN